ncbi:alkaline phosphatase family protein [soil metagenome]
MLPAYNGGSIANIPASILTGFETPPILQQGLLPPVGESRLPIDLLRDARVVILIVIDGLGADALDEAAGRGDVPGLMSAAHQTTLTSVFPPTTAAATTSLQYGVGLGNHGMAGYTLYLPEIDQVFNMITWGVAGNGSIDVNAPAPASFLRGPNLFNLLARAGIDPVIVSNQAFETSPLSLAQASGVRFRGYKTLADFTYRLIRELERPGRRFVYGYWDGFDALGHVWGADSSVARLELRLIDRALREGLFQPLESLGEDVALIVTADHGHADMPRDSRLDLAEIPGLLDALAHRPTGEPRQLGLAVREGSRVDVQALYDAWGDRIAVLTSADAIEAGLFGPPPHHPDLLARTGDILLLAGGAGSFTYPGGSTGSVGGHGSLTQREMAAPLLVWRWRRD